MSIRYVWEVSYKTDDKYKSEIRDYVKVISGQSITFFKAYDFDETTGIYSQTVSGNSFSVGSVSSPVFAPVGVYGSYATNETGEIHRLYQASANQANWDIFIGSNGKVTANLVPIGGSYPSKIIVMEGVKTSSGSTIVLKTVSSASRSAYKDGQNPDGNTYTYKGSDSIDPYSVTYSKSELQAGDKISVSANARTPVYGGIVYYQFSYSIDGGDTWTDIGSKTKNISVTVLVPEGAKQFQARVVTSDNLGYVSLEPVYGTTLGVSALKAYVSPSGKARAVTKIYISTSGKAREVVKGYVGANGKARKFL